MLALVTCGLGIRLAYLFAWQYPGHVNGDSYYYHYGANLFSDGRGFPNPFLLRKYHEYVPDAQHPPLTIILLAIPSLVGLSTYFDHQVYSCLLGGVSIGVVGLTGRRMGGPRTGLVAVGLAAVYPGFWLNDPVVLSETPSILACSLTLLLAYRFLERRTLVRAVWLGVILAADVLVRAELALLAVLLYAPLFLIVRGEAWKRRLGLAGAAAGTCVVILAPWVAYNMSRFVEPEFISTGLGSTLIVANCPQTYSGDFLGWWVYTCGEKNEPKGDFSQKDVGYRDESLDFISAHKDEVPKVAAVRVGRLWGLYRPDQQLLFDRIEFRQITWNRIGLWMLYAFEALSIAGVVILRRRRVPVLPPVSLIATVTLSAALIYGTTRFRSSAGPAVVLLSSVALEAALFGAIGAWRSRRGVAGDHADEAASSISAPPAGAGSVTTCST